MYPDTNDPTKNICIYCLLSLVLIIIFMFTPLRNYSYLGLLVKAIICFILAYCFYLNTIQIKNLVNSKSSNNSALYKRYLNANVFFSSIFSIFMFVLLCFVLKSFWN